MPVEKLYELLWSFASSRVITVAGKCGMLRALAERRQVGDDLADSLGLDRLATGKLLRALCALELVEAQEDGYRLAQSLQPYFLPGESDLTRFVDHSHHLYDRWGASLEDWVRTGVEVRRARTGSELEKFASAMQASASLIAPQVVSALDGMQGIRRVLDLGGGTGGYALAFLRAKADLEVTVIDIPEVAKLGRKKASVTAYRDRIEFKGGDYHQIGLGSGYDLALLANVLHIERPEAAARLVGRAASVLKPGGQLAVVDFAIDDEQRKNLMGCLFAINMRSHGDTHPEPAIRSWMEAAAITGIRRLELPPAHWLIAGRRS